MSDQLQFLFSLSLGERAGERACRRQALHSPVTPLKGRGRNHTCFNQLDRALLNSVVQNLFAALCAVTVIWAGAAQSQAQNPAPNTETQRKANIRPAEPVVPKADPFDGATIEKMTGQCVTIDTESGAIVIEMLSAKACGAFLTWQRQAPSTQRHSAAW